MPVLVDIAALASCPPAGGPDDVGLIADAALAWEGGTIQWVGPAHAMPAELVGRHRESAAGGMVVPGLIDCHTHLAFGGDRAGEFVERLRGVSYQAIAARGGGILETMRATRATSEDDLAAGARRVLGRMLRHGVTTVEAKSGYGLTLDDEIKTLRAYRRLAAEGPQRLVSTLLGAHAVPPEYREDRESYLDLLVERLIPAVAEAGLATFNDAFVEHGAFSPAEARRVFDAGSAHGLVPRVHADQLSDTGGGGLAADVMASSADHLEHVSDESIAAMAVAGVVAVSLPIATLVLDQVSLPARRLIEAGVPVAVATDFNPGSAPAASMPLAMWLACTRQRMTPAEVLRGATTNAARALRMDDRVGSIAPGMAADFVVVDAPDPDGWMYHFREDAAVRVVIAGRTAWARTHPDRPEWEAEERGI